MIMGSGGIIAKVFARERGPFSFCFQESGRPSRKVIAWERTPSLSVMRFSV